MTQTVTRNFYLRPELNEVIVVMKTSALTGSLTESITNDKTEHEWD